MGKKILILCTGNSCRSQMAEAFLRSFGPELEVYSAGTHPEKNINPNTITVMKEIGIDVAGQYPKNVNEFIDNSFDYVVTVCDDAQKTCPVFTGKVRKQLHLSFLDPAATKGSKEKVLNEYREVRDELRSAFRHFYDSKLK